MNKFASLITKNLTEKHAYVLTALLENGNTPINKFTAHCMVTHQAVTLLIDRLELELGYVRRIAHKTDRRVRLVSLTPKGRSFAKSID